MRPGGSVETLHDAAQRQVGIVRDRDEGQLPPGGRGALDQLAERLDAVEGAALVVSRDPDPLLPDLQGVGSRTGLDAAFGSLPGPEVDLEHRTLLRRGEEAEVVGEPAPEILDAEALRQVERSGTVCRKVVGRRVDDDAPVVHPLSRHGQDILRFGTLRREVELRLLCGQVAAEEQSGGECCQ